MGTNQIGDELHFTVCGSRNTMAPEVIGELGYTKSAEIYSIGVLFYCMLYHQTFFDRNLVDFDSKKGVLLAETIDLVKSMLEVDPKKRLTFQQLYEKRNKLQHSFTGDLNKINFDSS